MKLGESPLGNILDRFIGSLNYDIGRFKDYSEEFTKSFNQNCYRSTINLGWGLFMYHLYTLIEKQIGAKEFAKDYSANRPEKKRKLANSASDLSNFTDEEIITGLYLRAFLTDANIRRTFVQLKDTRGMSSHINITKYSSQKVETFLEDLMNLIDYINKHLGEQKLIFDSDKFNQLKEDELKDYIEGLSLEDRKKLFDFIFEVFENLSSIYEDKEFLDRNIREEFTVNRKYFKTLEYLYNSSSQGDKARLLTDILLKINLFSERDYQDLLISQLRSYNLIRESIPREAARILVKILLDRFLQQGDFYARGNCMQDISFFFRIFEDSEIKKFISLAVEVLSVEHYSWSAFGALKTLLKDHRKRIDSVDTYRSLDSLIKSKEEKKS